MDRHLLLSVATAIVAVGASCAPTFQPKSCTTDDDCGASLVCVPQIGGAQASVCRSPADAPLHIGMSAPISGPSQDLGIEMKKGVALAFDAQNAAGGVKGRKLVLDFRDDQYNPDNAEAAVRDLLDVHDEPGTSARCPTTTTPLVAGQSPVGESAMARGPNGVFALLGNVGTPTMVRTAPLAVETGTIFFGAFTGSAKMLRDGASGPCAKYIFNVRASYAQEARATVEFFMKLRVPDAAHLVSFDQNDTFGQAGYDGLVAAYTALKGPIASPADPTNPIRRFRYTRDDATSVPAQVDATAKYLAQLLASDAQPHAVGILMTDTYGPATEYITGVRAWQYANDPEQAQTQKASRLTLYFSNVSFVGPNSLAQRLKDAGQIGTPSGAKPYTDGVFVSQVVPNYESDDSDVVHDYKHALDAVGLGPSFTSLEGYIAARVFVAGLLANDRALTGDALVDAFEHLPSLALGLGASSGFSPESHQYSKSVWGTGIGSDGTFSNEYFWTDGTPLQLFE
jgi:ABC-type branched-subunit amino acid transport system substrate-binding protein